MRTLALSIALALPLGACHRETATPTEGTATDVAASTSVVGTWQLVALQCFCPANRTVPNQRLALDSARRFQFFDNDKLVAAGTYTLGTGSACSGAASTDALLRVTPTTPNAFAPHGNYTLRGDTLIIDQCLAADGPRYTFRRRR
jgi:hypothetical protein